MAAGGKHLQAGLRSGRVPAVHRRPAYGATSSLVVAAVARQGKGMEGAGNGGRPRSRGRCSADPLPAVAALVRAGGPGGGGGYQAPSPGSRGWAGPGARRAAALGLPLYDYWLFDDDRVVLMLFNSAGELTGRVLIQHSDAPGIVGQHCRWRDLAVENAAMAEAAATT